jgi:hypothetical protein
MDFSPTTSARRLAFAAGLIGCGVVASASVAELLNPDAVQAQNTPSLMEFRWESDKNYRKLYYVQTSTRQRERSDYFFMIRPKDRKTAILKLSITIPDYFNARIRPRKLKLCKMKKGGMLSRSRCEEVIPAVFEISENQSAIEVFPETPIPTEDTYAVSMTIFNPSQSGMFQFNALAQAPGDVPVAGYLGSWNFSID